MEKINQRLRLRYARRQRKLHLQLLSVFTAVLYGTVLSSSAMACPEAFNQDIRKLHSKETANVCNLNPISGPILVVNTASKCGFTPQFKALEALHKKYKDQGLTVVGFPSDSFNQEAKDEADTASVCYINYGVTFTMFETAPIKGEDASPVFQYLAKKSTEPKWNFNKYLVLDGKVLHFRSDMKPFNSELEAKIVAALENKPQS